MIETYLCCCSSPLDTQRPCRWCSTTPPAQCTSPSMQQTTHPVRAQSCHSDTNCTPPHRRSCSSQRHTVYCTMTTSGCRHRHTDQRDTANTRQPCHSRCTCPSDTTLPLTSSLPSDSTIQRLRYTRHCTMRSTVLQCRRTCPPDTTCTRLHRRRQSTDQADTATPALSSLQAHSIDPRSRCTRPSMRHLTSH